MFSKTVRWGIGIGLLIASIQYSSPTAYADTILEIPRSDARLFCANDLSSTPILTPEAMKKQPVEGESSLIVPIAQAADIQNTPTTPSTQPLLQEKPASSLDPNVLFDIINSYRANIGLPAFQKDQAICDIAKQRGPALDYEVETGAIHAGFYAMNLPYWATENVKYGGNEQDMFNWWMNSYIHRQAIVGDYKYSCTECYGKSCNQIFTNYVAK